MSETFLSRTGRRMPVPTRAKYHSSASRLAREATNRARLIAARTYFGKVFIRVMPQVRLCPDRPHQYGALLGYALTVRVLEVVDVFDLWNNLYRFVAAWRPKRLRTERAQQGADQCLDEWERLGNGVR